MAEIDKVRPGIVRAREGQATASYYEGHRRITVVADNASFADALAAVTALRDEVC
ncbi:hypothetical protein H7K45_27775 [Mycobacterium yunnanensis]|uniref:Uncharacterized protein n=1 Tax=Mycobacterium yunnanensis TaxID=368477 RepID=A0A9X2Z8V1_9MYCO|nr:hypothetical protein [Mycobacterium yunnanensis]MCV7424351.1 hypothetical protein [Mycobacterium yunnanensis]